MGLSEVEDCYNLMLKIAPVMITRGGNDGYFEIIYPEKKIYNIEDRVNKLFCVNTMKVIK